MGVVQTDAALPDRQMCADHSPDSSREEPVGIVGPLNKTQSSFKTCFSCIFVLYSNANMSQVLYMYDAF